MTGSPASSATAAAPAAGVAALRAALGDGKTSTAPSVLREHAHDENYPAGPDPAAVVYAESVDDVRAVLAETSARGMSVIPFGTGTSAEGRVVPVNGKTVSLNMTRMNAVLDVRPQDFQAVVQPGVTRTQLNRALRGHGLFFPVDPGADASLGGMAATNASGTTTVRYGGMRPNVASLQVVLANGDVLRLGRPVRKTSSGYDLKDLFIGSGGTLGVITELTVNLHPAPEAVVAFRVEFPNVQTASSAAYAAVASGLPVARLELVDATSIRALNAYLGGELPEAPALWVELHSSSSVTMRAEQAELEELLRDNGAVSLVSATTARDLSALWEARHQLFWALRALWPGREMAIGDTAVPLSTMPAVVERAQATMARLGLDGIVAGHVGDGNVHTIIATDPGDERATEFTDDLVQYSLALGGTSTGEHGIGLAKRKYLRLEHGEAAEWMRRVKELFDPLGTLNPGKDV